MSLAKLSLFLILLFTFQLFAQDERFYRKIFTGQLVKVKKEVPNYKLVIDTATYQLDLNRDGIDEQIAISNKDGRDFLIIKDSPGNIIFENGLDTVGHKSKLFKLSLKTISKDTDVLILHYYEGQVDAVDFESRARLYFVTIDHRKLQTLSLFKGPYFWHEKENPYTYINRNYTVNVFDYNNDGRNEVSVNFNHIAKIYFYLEEGRWKRF